MSLSPLFVRNYKPAVKWRKYVHYVWIMYNVMEAPKNYSTYRNKNQARVICKQPIKWGLMILLTIFLFFWGGGVSQMSRGLPVTGWTLLDLADIAQNQQLLIHKMFVKQVSKILIYTTMKAGRLIHFKTGWFWFHSHGFVSLFDPYCNKNSSHNDHEYWQKQEATWIRNAEQLIPLHSADS